LALALQESMNMDLEFDVEQGAKRAADLTKIEPSAFRGVDCAVLAERYVAYRRNMGLDEIEHDPDEIKPAAVPSSANA
jgi:hypothetical protein